MIFNTTNLFTIKYINYLHNDVCDVDPSNDVTVYGILDFIIISYHNIYGVLVYLLTH